MSGLLSSWTSRLRRDKPERSELARVKTETREVLALSDDTTLAVNEIVCADPACPGTETIILVMIPGARTRALKIAMPVEEVTREDVAAAWEAG